MKILIFLLLLVLAINLFSKPIPIEIKKKQNDLIVISPEKIEENSYYLFNESDMNDMLSYMEALTKPVNVPKIDNTKWYIITSVLATSLLISGGYIYLKRK